MLNGIEDDGDHEGDGERNKKIGAQLDLNGW